MKVIQSSSEQDIPASGNVLWELIRAYIQSIHAMICMCAPAVIPEDCLTKPPIPEDVLMTQVAISCTAIVIRTTNRYLPLILKNHAVLKGEFPMYNIINLHRASSLPFLFMFLLAISTLQAADLSDKTEQNTNFQASMAQYDCMFNGVIHCTEVFHHPADNDPQASATYDFSPSLRYRIPYTPEAIQKWIESRTIPYSQTYDTTLSFCGNIYRYDAKSAPGPFHAHGFDATQVWDEDKYVLIDHLAKTASIHDVQSFKKLYYDVYPHPKLIVNPPAFLLKSPDRDRLTHEFIPSPKDADVTAIIVTDDKGHTIALADIFSEGFIGSRNAQFLSYPRYNLVSIHTVDSVKDAFGMSVFPRQIRFTRHVRSNSGHEDPKVLLDFPSEFVETISAKDYYTDLIVEDVSLNNGDISEKDIYPLIPQDYQYVDTRSAIVARRISEGKDGYVGGTGSYDYLNINE